MTYSPRFLIAATLLGGVSLLSCNAAKAGLNCQSSAQGLRNIAKPICIRCLPEILLEGKEETFTVSLPKPPSETEVVNIKITPSTEMITIKPHSLIFDNDNWSQHRTVKIVPKDDKMARIDQEFTISFSSPEEYFDEFDETLTLKDNDIQVSILKSDGSSEVVNHQDEILIDEKQIPFYFSASLKGDPEIPVTVNVHASSDSHITVSLPSLTFNEADDKEIEVKLVEKKRLLLLFEVSGEGYEGNLIVTLLFKDPKPSVTVPLLLSIPLGMIILGSFMRNIKINLIKANEKILDLDEENRAVDTSFQLKVNHELLDISTKLGDLDFNMETKFTNSNDERVNSDLLAIRERLDRIDRNMEQNAQDVKQTIQGIRQILENP